MKPRFSFLLSAALASLSIAAHAAVHVHEHEQPTHDAPQKLQLDAGKKWATDTALRQAMGNINQAMADALPRIHQKRFSDNDYETLAATVVKEVAYAVEHCKLEPKADAMLHLVIADLTEGATIMEGKSKTPRHDGAIKIVQALKAYGQYFDHPGWKAARG